MTGSSDGGTLPDHDGPPADHPGLFSPVGRMMQMRGPQASTEVRAAGASGAGAWR